ncbi:MAG TPA: sulfur carrier protein ThiS [Xanthobacteraceae bacterium]|nr:sulfur carrier protein ThiS [Xanthobacteraceae bacterium]
MNAFAGARSEPTILVNGAAEPLGDGTILALLSARGIEAGGRGFAVAVNGAVVPRAAWGDTRLKPGDTVEIVQAKQGG